MLVEFMKEEDDLYAKYIREQEEYSLSLHKEDARRIMIEEERLKIQHDVAEVREELTGKIKTITEEHLAIKRTLEEKHSVEAEGLQKQIEVIREQMKERVGTLENDKAALEKSLEDMRARYASAHADAAANCKSQVDQANANAEAWQNTIAALQAQQKHQNRLAVIIMVAVSIAMLAIGFVVAGIWFKNSFDGVLAKNQETVSAAETTAGFNSDEPAGVTSETADTTKSIFTAKPAETAVS